MLDQKLNKVQSEKFEMISNVEIFLVCLPGLQEKFATFCRTRRHSVQTIVDRCHFHRIESANKLWIMTNKNQYFHFTFSAWICYLKYKENSIRSILIQMWYVLKPASNTNNKQLMGIDSRNDHINVEFKIVFVYLSTFWGL